MTVNNKENEQIYVKICPLANTIPDIDDSPLTRTEVKKIFMNTKNLNFDINHNHKFLSGIEIKEQYISQEDEYIKGVRIPAGSWMMIIAVYNKKIQELLLNEEVTGVSLWTDLSDDVILIERIFNDNVPYKNIKNKEAMNPSSISFTKNPANRLPLEIWDKHQYTAKSRKKEGESNMNDKDDIKWYQNMLEKLMPTRHTSKQYEPTPQPVDNGLYSDEVITSIIESQKNIPHLAELVEKQTENQVKQSELIGNLKTEIGELKLEVAELKMGEAEVKQDPVEPEDKDDEGKDVPQDPVEPEDTDGEVGQHTAKTAKTNIIPTTDENEDDEQTLQFIANRSVKNLTKGGKL